MENSPIWNLNWKDFGKGAVVAVISAVISFLLQALQGGGSIEPMLVLNVACVSFLSYLLKNLSTDASGENIVITGVAKIFNK